MPFIKHKFGKTYFESSGKMGNKVPYIHLHGGPGGRAEQVKAALRLGTNNRKVFIYDQIGSNKSSATLKKFWNMKTFVEELHILVNKWGLDKFHLGGTSCGSTLALEYYLQKDIKEKRIQSIVFQSPFFSAKDWMKDARLLIKKLPKKTQKTIHYCQEVGATDSEVYQNALLDYYERFVLRNRKILENRRSNPNPTGKKIYAHMWGSSEFNASGTLRTYERADFLKKIQIPTLFIAGEYDEARPETLKKYYRHVRNAQIKIIPNTSHAIMTEDPKSILKVIDQFLII